MLNRYPGDFSDLSNFSAKSCQVESFLASLFYCTFRCCHLKENPKQNSKKVSMKSSFDQQYQSRIIEPSRETALKQNLPKTLANQKSCGKP